MGKYCSVANSLNPTGNCSSSADAVWWASAVSVSYQ